MKDPQKITGQFNTEVRRTAQEIAIRKRGADLSEKANSHFEKHRATWVNQRFEKLLKSKAAPAPELTPNGMRETPAQKASKAASLQIEMKQKSRLSLINEKVERMVSREINPQKALENKKGLER